MSFPHFGHPYGSASQVRGASAGDGGTPGGWRGCPLPRGALLSHASPGKPKGAGGGVMRSPLGHPQSLPENVQLPKHKLENWATRNLDTLAGAPRGGSGLGGLPDRSPISPSFCWPPFLSSPCLGWIQTLCCGFFHVPDPRGCCAVRRGSWGNSGDTRHCSLVFLHRAGCIFPRSGPSLTSDLLCDLGQVFSLVPSPSL